MRITIDAPIRLIAIFLVFAIALEARSSTPTTRQAIDEVIRQNEASRAKIRTIEFDLNLDDRTFGHYVYQGTDRANSYITSHRTLNTNCVMNDRLIALWVRTSASPPEIYLRDADKRPSRDVLERIHTFAGYDPLWCGFGATYIDARDVCPASIDASHYRVEQARNEQNERVTRISLLFTDVIGEAPQVTYEFNADRGYLLTRTKGYNELGWLTGTCEVTTSQIDGVWVPTRARTTQFRFKAGSKQGEPRVVREQMLTNIRVNQPVDPAQFELASLGIPDGAEILEYDTKGKMTERKMSATQPSAVSKP